MLAVTENKRHELERF